MAKHLTGRAGDGVFRVFWAAKAASAPAGAVVWEPDESGAAETATLEAGLVVAGAAVSVTTSASDAFTEHYVQHELLQQLHLALRHCARGGHLLLVLPDCFTRVSAAVLYLVYR